MQLVVLEQVMRVVIRHQKETLVEHLLPHQDKQVVVEVVLEQQDKMHKVTVKLEMVEQV